MYAESIYSLFLLIFQIPVTILIERIGSRKSLILGTILGTIQIMMMIFIHNFFLLVIAYLMSALGDAIKDVARNTLLYDSTKICKGRNSFSNINARGSSISYALGAITSIFTGYLFVINPYIPLVLSSIVSIIAVIISCRFEEVRVEKSNKMKLSQSIKEMKQGFKLILKSNRLKALYLFTSIFVGILMMISTYEKSILTDLQVNPKYFGIIFSILTLVQCFSVRYQEKIHTIFTNRTLTFLSVPIFLSFIMIGICTNLDLNFYFIILVIIVGFFIQHFLRAPYWVLRERYMTYFTNSNTRAKVLSTSNFVESIGRILISFLGGLLLEFYTTSVCYLIVGVGGFIILLLVLKYMKKRVGIQSEEKIK